MPDEVLSPCAACGKSLVGSEFPSYGHSLQHLSQHIAELAEAVKLDEAATRWLKSIGWKL